MGVAGKCPGIGKSYRAVGYSDTGLGTGGAIERTEPDCHKNEKSADESLEAAERDHILRALRESRGQIGGLRGAAMRLGLKRTTLQSKLKRFGINPRSVAKHV